MLIVLGIPIALLLLIFGVYREERIGHKGVAFNLLKIQSMSNDTSLPERDRSSFTQRLLRKTKLDELPQLLNIAKGEMAIVGPRPLPTRYQDRIPRPFQRRFDVKPGLTGLVQISGGNSLSWLERFKLDNVYVERRTLLLDLKIILLTPIALLRNGGDHLGTELSESDFIENEAS
ncbi:MAG: sugar transferase [Oceanospirillaceae bacterium]|nr:sugar transferase [Oceanospirillaceae bacterium]